MNNKQIQKSINELWKFFLRSFSKKIEKRVEKNKRQTTKMEILKFKNKIL